MAKRFVLTASATFHGRIVEERFVRQGVPLQIGNSPALAVPVPEGVPYLARIAWTAPDQAQVTDGESKAYLLTVDRPVVVRLGAVELQLTMSGQQHVPWLVLPSWKGSVAWLTIVLMSTVVVQQLDLLWSKRCEWFGICQQEPPSDGGAGGANVTAEYLARLLREDYAGDEEGLIVTEIDRPDAERKAEKENQFYMPAGADGPVTKMGGAAETAPEPIRTPKEEVDSAAKKAQEVVRTDEGEPVPDRPEDQQDGVADALLEGEGEEAGAEPPAEETEGWGVPDWYDEKDAQMDQLEIDVMLQVSRRRLKIDPDDQQALSVLSYYQYLAQDYEAAKRTYERYIALFPDEPAGFNNMALVYKRLGDYQREENLYRVALSLEPEDVTALNNLAVNLAHQHRFDEALAVMKRLEDLDPGDPYAELHRSKVYAEMGDDAAALAYLDKALRGMQELDTLHHIEFRQDIRVDPSFERLRGTYEFRATLDKYYGKDSPLQE